MNAFLQVKCPSCGKEMKARSELAGKRVKCSRTTCNVIFTAPELEPNPDSISTAVDVPEQKLEPTFVTPPTPRAPTRPTPVRPAPTRVVSAKPVPQPADPDDGIPSFDSKVVLKWTVGASVGFLAFMMLLVLGLYWRSGQPSAEQAKAYEAFIRTGNELADLNDKIVSDRDYQLTGQRQTVVYEHIRYLNEIDAVRGRQKDKLESKYETETKALAKRLKAQIDSTAPNIVVVGQTKPGEYYTTTRNYGQTTTNRTPTTYANSSRYNKSPYGSSYPGPYAVEDEPRIEMKMAEPYRPPPSPYPTPPSPTPVPFPAPGPGP